jgi:L-ascorbate metabolism protein UlaG (beta-lactamase superfamily)
MAIFILAFVLAIPIVVIVTGILLSGPRYPGPKSDHFNGSRFINPHGVKAKGGRELLKWMINRKRGRWQEQVTENYGKHPLSHFRGGIRITYVNHSTFLIQVDGLNILTDPIWSKRASPFRWIGPQRMRPPGIRFGDLPRIHLVVLSHNHYDHLDMDTMRMVSAAHHPRVIAPLGVKALLDREYISGVSEIDWWDEVEVDHQVTIQAVPAQHFSGRGMLDRDATLWCGYVLKTGAGNIYFVADTGYNEEMFKDIPKRCGPIKLSLIPIGAYKPGWFISPIHVSPEEAVRIHLDTECETSIAMHFGTFPLADDGYDDPVQDLSEAITKYSLSRDSFIVMREGEFRVFE